MIRNHKKLGIALAVFLVLGAVGAALALATEDKLKSESASGSTFMTGQEVKGLNQVFTITDKFQVSCANVVANGTVTGNEFKSFTVHPVYNGEAQTCSSTGGSALVETKSCNYVFQNDTDANQHANLEIECDGGNTIRIKVAGCTIKIEPQTARGIRYENENPGKPSERAIRAYMTTTSTKEGWVSEGLVCPTYGLPEKTGTIKNSHWFLTADITFKGYVDEGGVEKGQTGIWTE